MAGDVSVAFVLGGGGQLGACEVGMLEALTAHGVTPDVVLGTSVGAINGAIYAAAPERATLARLREVWGGIQEREVFGESLVGRLGTLARTRTALHSAEPLRALLAEALGDARIEQLPLRFECVAASIEGAREHWFAEGPAVDAVLASAAVPGLLPPVRIGREHFVDGGIVNSIPVGRAVALGASVVYVLQVGRVDQPLEPPRWPWEVGLVAFEIARRHRFASDLAELPEGVEVHVLPTGDQRRERPDYWAQLRYRDFGSAAARIERAREASEEYLSARVEARR